MLYYLFFYYNTIISLIHTLYIFIYIYYVHNISFISLSLLPSFFFFLHTKMNDDENNNNNKDQEYDLESQKNLISIKVKTLTNMSKLTIPKKTKVLSFKQKIIKEYLKEQALGKRIRLIHAGKVLDDAKDISSYKLKENTCIHAALSDIVPTNNNNNNNNRNRQNNEGGDDDDEEEEEQNYRGFDRLRQGGTFSREDVEIIRSTFYQEVLEYERTQRRRPREDEAERYYRMEEEWISRQGPTSDFALNVATRRIRNNNNNSNDTEMDRIVRSFYSTNGLLEVQTIL